MELVDGRIFAITDPASDPSWTELDRVSAEDVRHTAGMLSARDFAKAFPDADPSRIPAKPLSRSAWKEAAERAMWAVEVQRKMKELRTMSKGRPN